MTEAQKRTVENKAIVKDVEEFITYFDGTQDNFLHGNCYWFAQILFERFWRFYPEVEVMYNQIDNHFAVAILANDTTFLFDASGCIGPLDSQNWVRWNDYIRIEPLDAARVYRDCIWHMQDTEWKELGPKARKEPWYFVKRIS
jgi:hypothetical protein